MLCPACVALLGCPVCFALYAGTPVTAEPPADAEPELAGSAEADRAGRPDETWP